jgi:hypothetical protein
MIDITFFEKDGNIGTDLRDEEQALTIVGTTARAHGTRPCTRGFNDPGDHELDTSRT